MLVMRQKSSSTRMGLRLKGSTVPDTARAAKASVAIRVTISARAALTGAALASPNSAISREPEYMKQLNLVSSCFCARSRARLATRPRYSSGNAPRMALWQAQTATAMLSSDFPISSRELMAGHRAATVGRRCSGPSMLPLAEARPEMSGPIQPIAAATPSTPMRRTASASDGGRRPRSWMPSLRQENAARIPLVGSAAMVSTAATRGRSKAAMPPDSAVSERLVATRCPSW
mmetsp:Transcript_18679/g.70980  ORF Transcript_18679/g.70980 Transcript_18679/m.70980 type:complete len:232 (+) Transcript_18679:1755-2450(+)